MSSVISAISSPPATPAPLFAGNSAVRQSRAFLFARQPLLSVFSKRIVACVMAQISAADATLLTRYTVRLHELAHEAALSFETVRTVMPDTVKELAQACWEIQDPTGRWRLQPLLDTSTLAGACVREGELTLALHPDLAPHFCRIAGQYFTFQLAGYP